MADREGPPLLDVEQLDRLEAAWAAQGAPIVDHLAPGLPESEIDELTAPLGLRLPAEARLWWGWHDGSTAATPGSDRPSCDIGGGAPFMSLRDAVENYLLDRRVFAEVEGDPEPFRPREYFPITWQSGPTLCDCSVPEGAATPIYVVHSHDWSPDRLESPAARSFGEMVGWWIEALEDGVWEWDRSTGRWTVDHERLDAARARSGLLG